MRIVIVGGGFGGVKAALELEKDRNFEVVLISDKSHFLYYPTLYSTATGESHRESVVQLTEIFEARRVKLVEATMTGLDMNRKMVKTTEGEFHYDAVILALGVVTTYFGIDGLDTYSYSIKSHEEIKRFKKHLHDEITEDRHMDKNYVVVGAGPTGVELSSALVGYLEELRVAHKVKRSKIRVKLVEAAPRVLPRMSESTSRRVLARLKDIGVDVQLGKTVEKQDNDSIIISGKDVPTETVVWTSGVANHPFYKEHDFPLAKNGRVAVDDNLMAFPDVFVIGDNADTQYTGLAQTALHDGIYVSRYLKAKVAKRHLPTYHPVKPPVLIPVGKAWALLEWGPLKIWGTIGALIKSAAHIIGYRDVFPLGLALGAWRSHLVREEDCEVCLFAKK